MVYLGRPSRGCATCKARRIKCDETRPACNNCIKTHRECPGLPQEIDLIFRAEDPGRRRKAKKGAGAEAGCKSEASRLEGYGKLVTSPAICAKNLSICVEYETAQLSLENQSLALRGLPRRTSTSEDITTYQYEDLAADQRFLGQIDLESQMRFNPVIEEQATTFFFNNFVLSPRAPDITRGFLEVAAPLFHATVDGSSLHLATQAHSLLVIAHWPGRKHLRDRAQQLYSQALKAIQKDLQDSRKATSDDTVLAVLILSLFEATNAGRDPAGAQAWARHIEGATTLVRARGATQFDNPKSYMVFRAVRTQMLTNAIQQRKPLPDFPDGWTSDLDGKESAASALIKYYILLPDLLARAKRIFAAERTMDSFAQVQILLGEAFEMQGRLTDWEHSMPPQWGYRSLAITPEPVNADQIEHLEAWPGVLHIYRDVHTACIRNNNRVTQMYYCTIVIDALKWLFGEKFDTDERYYASMYRLQTLVDEICYSVPFHLYGAEAANGVRHIDRIQNAGQALGGYFLIWPLYAASNIEDVPCVQRRWLRGRLDKIAQHYGLDHAGLMCSINKGRSGANWKADLQFGSNDNCPTGSDTVSRPL